MKEIRVVGVEGISRKNHSHLDFSDLSEWLYYLNTPFALLRKLGKVSPPAESQGVGAPSSLTPCILSPM